MGTGVSTAFDCYDWIDTSGQKYWTGINSFGGSGYWWLQGDPSTGWADAGSRWSNDADYLPVYAEYLLCPYNSDKCGASSALISIGDNSFTFETGILSLEDICIYKIYSQNSQAIGIKALQLQNALISVYEDSSQTHNYDYVDIIDESNSKLRQLEFSNTRDLTSFINSNEQYVYMVTLICFLNDSCIDRIYEKLSIECSIQNFEVFKWCILLCSWLCQQVTAHLLELSLQPAVTQIRKIMVSLLFLCWFQFEDGVF